MLQPFDNLVLSVKGALYREGDGGDAVHTIRRRLARLMHDASNGARRIASIA